MNLFTPDSHGTIGNLEIIQEYLQRLNITGDFDYCLTVFAGDNGVSREGISSYQPLSSAEIVHKHLNSHSFSRILMDRLQKTEILIDVGLFTDIECDGLLNMKVAHSTRNLNDEAAMNRCQVEQALAVGRQVASMLGAKGIKVFGLGEIGVGNTVSAYVLASEILDIVPEGLVGLGSTRNNERYARRLEIVQNTCGRIRAKGCNLIATMEEAGSSEIIAMAGAVLGAAENGLGVVLDGFVSSVAALLACRLEPRCREVLLASTLGREPGHKMILDELDLCPIFDIGINYGEGLAAGIGLFLLEMTHHFFNKEDFLGY
ncbi:MAG: nicotinate-nucleotide--dimethylbenzimidazole phosphoribosyltransferase [Acidobacteriota bacterium]